jgi:hypothetical protein
MEGSWQEPCCQFLKAEGFPIVDIDEDGDVVFRAEGKYYILYNHQDHPERFALALPAFWSLDDTEEADRALSAANTVNVRFSGATVVCLSHTVTAFTQLFLANPAADLQAVFYPSLKAVQIAAHAFAARMLQGEPPDPPPGGSAAVPAPGGNGTPVGGYL